MLFFYRTCLNRFVEKGIFNPHLHNRLSIKTLDARAIPLSLTERNALGEGEVLSVPMSFEEYLDWGDKCEYSVEYIDSHLVSMGQVTFIHEALIARLIMIFGRLLDFNSYTTLGSNIRIFSPSFLPEKYGAYHADVSVAKGLRC